MTFKKVAPQSKPAPKAAPAKPRGLQSAPSPDHNGPVHKINMYPVEAAIWQNYTEDGRSMYSVTFQRSYKTREGEWKRSNSFSGTDLLVLAAAANHAYHRINEARQRDRSQEVEKPREQSPAVIDEDVPF